MRFGLFVKHRLTFLFLAVFCLCDAAKADPFQLNRSDRQAHFVAGYALSVTTMELLRPSGVVESVLYSSIFAMTVATLKEYAVDRKPDNGDIWATGLGSTFGVGFFLTTDALSDW